MLSFGAELVNLVDPRSSSEDRSYGDCLLVLRSQNSDQAGIVTPGEVQNHAIKFTLRHHMENLLCKHCNKILLYIYKTTIIILVLWQRLCK